MLHRFAKLVAACTVLLLLAGSLVTSTDSGLAVPDWPTTYGWNLFTFPPSMWVGGIFYEHGHRLIASGVGLLTIVLAVWLWLEDPRRWMRRLGAIALVTVILQGVLGGITVLYFLPAAVSTAHAGLAEIFFCLTIAIALFTSPRWIAGHESVDDAPAPAPGDGYDGVDLRADSRGRDRCGTRTPAWRSPTSPSCSAGSCPIIGTRRSPSILPIASARSSSRSRSSRQRATCGATTDGAAN